MPNTFTWIANSGNWSAPTNWNPVGVPGSDATRSDEAVISLKLMGWTAPAERHRVPGVVVVG